MKLRAEIKQQAKAGFTAQYGACLCALLLMVIGWAISSVSFAINAGDMLHNFTVRITGYGTFQPFAPITSFFSTLSTLVSIFVLLPLTVGYNAFSLRVYRGEEADVGGMLWMALFTFLWTLLFIVPGIIKALAYFMTPYILADCPDVTATDALKLSMRMTSGHKGKVFVMGLSFIGWGILTALTGGILGIFYTGPYINTSFAGLYHELKQEALAKGVVSPAELGMAA